MTEAFTVPATSDNDASLSPTQRRLSDRILVAFHSACDERDLVTASELLKTADHHISRQLAAGHQIRLKELEALVGAFYRFAELGHIEASSSWETRFEPFGCRFESAPLHSV